MIDQATDARARMIAALLDIADEQLDDMVLMAMDVLDGPQNTTGREHAFAAALVTLAVKLDRYDHTPHGRRAQFKREERERKLDAGCSVRGAEAIMARVDLRTALAELMARETAAAERKLAEDEERMAAAARGEPFYATGADPAHVVGLAPYVPGGDTGGDGDAKRTDPNAG